MELHEIVEILHEKEACNVQLLNDTESKSIQLAEYYRGKIEGYGIAIEIMSCFDNIFTKNDRIQKMFNKIVESQQFTARKRFLTGKKHALNMCLILIGVNENFSCKIG